jgi:hypothetical protein
MTKAATLATFSDFRTVKGRKVCQLIFEVPMEAANEALQALGGVPSPVDPVWCGIARVQPKATSEPLKAVERDPRDRGKLLPRRKWEDLTPAQQAGIRCQEQEFEDFIRAKFMTAHASNGRTIPEFVREYCGVSSRSLIFKGSAAEQRWNLLESGYQAWLSERQYAEVIR